MVASGRIQNLFPILSYLYYADRPYKRFLYRCADTDNPAAMFRSAMMDFFWIGHDVSGMEGLNEAATAGDVEARYICSLLLMCHENEDDHLVRMGHELYETVRASGAVESCRKFFQQVFAGPWSEINPTDPAEAVACRSGSCPTRGTMTVASDLSGVSCVQCLAEYEVRNFLATVYF
ncbi:hypothetical protein Ahy_B09g096479 [Arachis hypogaea]|uniref:At2g35280-like TPR domain-containing protein n=1 Tax=Arachis hypogaea TaxID=3818 RepID=A0A444XKX2_ARAHY|nr:hypothetical protein Ahy_B09g096479 [Arachis hypogaea]